jgi:hypothetical protein
LLHIHVYEANFDSLHKGDPKTRRFLKNSPDFPPKQQGADSQAWECSKNILQGL